MPSVQISNQLIADFQKTYNLRRVLEVQPYCVEDNRKVTNVVLILGNIELIETYQQTLHQSNSNQSHRANTVVQYRAKVCSIQYEISAELTVKAACKDMIKKILGKSPDPADALCYANWAKNNNDISALWLAICGGV